MLIKKTSPLINIPSNRPQLGFCCFLHGDIYLYKGNEKLGIYWPCDRSFVFNFVKSFSMSDLR